VVKFFDDDDSSLILDATHVVLRSGVRRPD
jgi:hypothetical protein